MGTNYIKNDETGKSDGNWSPSPPPFKSQQALNVGSTKYLFMDIWVSLFMFTYLHLIEWH